MDVTLLVAIVNYRTPALVMDCLHSLSKEREQGISFEVVVVDNHSPDDSVERLAAFLSEGEWSWVHFAPQQVNGGFSYGNNRAVEFAKRKGLNFRYLLLLNPDTRVCPGSLKQLVDFMEAKPRAGIVGSRLIQADGLTASSAFRFPGVASEFAYNSGWSFVYNHLQDYIVTPTRLMVSQEVDWVSGASMLIRAELLEQIGWMDETYFLYYEEVDYCLAAKRAGWSCWYHPESVIIHYEGESTGAKDGKNRPPYWVKSRKYYFEKNYGVGYRVLCDLALKMGLQLRTLKDQVRKRMR